MTDVAEITCSVKAEQKGLPLGMARMMGLETAADMLGGKRQLSESLGISLRAAAYKVNGERGISNGDLLMTASALDKMAQRISDHAQKLRDVARG
jgi:hypothetical protein